MASWSAGPFMGFDTETTGVDTAKDTIITAALVEWRAGDVRTKTWLANPGVPIPESSTQIHGITDEIAQTHGQDLQTVVSETADYLVNAAKANVPIIVYNAHFDIPLLNNHLKRFSLPTLQERVDFLPVIDPLVIDRELDRFRKGKKTLLALTKHYGVEVNDEDLHDALVDVKTTIQVLLKIIDKFPELSKCTLEEMYEKQAAWYEKWAINMQGFLQSKGKDSDISTVWL